MYNPRTVACKTVIVTEQAVCPDVTVAYLDMPEITFAGSTASCRISVDAGAGETIDAALSQMDAWDGEKWVNLYDQFDYNVSSQVVNLTWNMAASTDICYVATFLRNTCGKDAGWVNTAVYSYTEAVADITATDITVTPSTCEAPCDIAVSITWENVGSMQGTFVPKFSINGVESDHTAQIILQPGGSYTMAQTLFNMPAGNYVICPSPN